MDSYYGGFSDAARMLDHRAPRADSKPHLRQQIWVWWKRRQNNGFPERYTIKVPCSNHKEKGCDKCDGSGYREVQLLALQEVWAWYLHYRPSPGGRPKGTGKKG